MISKRAAEYYFDTFKDTEDFLATLDPKKYDPPFMTTTFSVMRREAYDAIQKDIADFDSKKQKEILRLFIEKFETDYVEILRAKLREHYIDYILQKKYEIPSEVDMKEIESFGAISEIAQLAIAIAEWSLELEINAYTLEGLKMYGLLKDEQKGKTDYLSILKKEYNIEKKGSLYSAVEYVFRKVMTFTCDKVAHIALAHGLSSSGFKGKDIVEIVFGIIAAGNVPWKAVGGTMNISWVVGGYLCSHFVHRLNDYAVRRDALNHLAHVQETFEANKLHLMTERMTLLDLVEKTVQEEDVVKHEWELDVMRKTVENILAPKKKQGGMREVELAAIHGDNSKDFKVKEEDDCVVVEEKVYQEKEDESGVIVVDW